MSKYPVDMDALKKGDYITPDSIAEIYGVEISSEKFGLSVMKLAEFITRHSIERELPLLVKVERNGLRILPDEDAVDYTETRASQHRKGMRRQLMRMGWIDQKNLKDTTVEKLNRNVELLSKQVLAVKKCAKELKAAQYKRDVPLLGDKT